MLFESIIICIVALVTIVAIVLAIIGSPHWQPGMNTVLIVGIAAVVIVAWGFLRSAEFATPGADEFRYFLYLVAMVLCCCCCLCVAGRSDGAGLKAITN